MDAMIQPGSPVLLVAVNVSGTQQGIPTIWPGPAGHETYATHTWRGLPRGQLFQT